MKKVAYVIKANGEKERFQEKKIRQSLMSAGASKGLIKEVIKNIKERDFEEIPSQELLDIILRLLKKEKQTYHRYDLKRAIKDLGPTGFPFEKYFAKILEKEGYNTKINTYFKGKKIRHEVDIVARKDKEYMIECKFHNDYGTKVRIKDALYTYARYLDIKKNFDHPWLATNTKCTRDVTQYAKGEKMKITSWDQPKGESLKEMIEEKRLYPISILREIPKAQMQRFLECNIVLLNDLEEQDPEEIAKKTKIPKEKILNTIKKARKIIG